MSGDSDKEPEHLDDSKSANTQMNTDDSAASTGEKPQSSKRDSDLADIAVCLILALPDY